MPLRVSHTRALFRNTNYVFSYRWSSLLSQMAYSDTLIPQMMYFRTCASPEGINKTAWGIKLLLTAVLAGLVDCIVCVTYSR